MARVNIGEGEAYDHLANIEIVEAIESVFVTAMGSYFYFLIALYPIIAIYFKTESIEATGIVMFIIGGLGFTKTLFPGADASFDMGLSLLWVLLLSFGIAIIYFRFFRRE